MTHHVAGIYENSLLYRTVAMRPVHNFSQTQSVGPRLVLAMTDTLQQALRPLLITRFIIGSSVYPLKQSRPYLSVLYSLAVWYIYGYIYYCTVMFFTAKLIFYNIITIIIVEMDIFTTILSVVINLYYDKEFRICMKKLAAVDDTLEALGTAKIYGKIRIWSTRIIIAWIIYIIVINSMDSIWWINKKEISHWGGILMPYILNHCIHVNTFMDLYILASLWYIGNRFDEVNNHMRCLLTKQKHGLRCRWEKPVIAVRYILYTHNYKRILWISMHLHLELCRIARKLNSLFGKKMTCEMVGYLLFLTTLCYYAFIMLMQNQEIQIEIWFNLVMWATIFVIRLYCINYMCESVNVKASEINKIIHELTDYLRYEDVRMEIYQFALQVKLRPLRFTGMGLFYFGNDFLRKFFMTILTFVIIIVQMKMSTVP